MFSEIWNKKKMRSIFESSSCRSCSSSSDDEGLRILTKNSIGNSNVVVKLLKSKPPKSHSYDYDCYLKLCHLCLNPLNLDKEIYMYRGDLGFCSVECRERQIYLDETKEMEASAQRILSTFRQRGRGRCESETTKLLEEFRRRRHPFSSTRERVVFSFSN